MLTKTDFQPNKPVPNNQAIQAQMALSFATLVTGESIVGHHTIENGIMGVGKPIDAPKVRELVNAILADHTPSSWTNSKVIYENSAIVCWFRPACITKMWFSIGGKQKLSLDAPLPSLIFIRSKVNSSTSLFAYCLKGMPKRTQRLYQAPILNTSDSGSFCLGSATVPVGNIDSEEMIKGTEAAIFDDSAFSHTSCGITLNNHKHNKDKPISTDSYIKLYKSFAKKNYTPKASDLTSLNLTLEEAINQFIGRR
jgi:PRTRC genetic system protein B